MIRTTDKDTAMNLRHLTTASLIAKKKQIEAHALGFAVQGLSLPAEDQLLYSAIAAELDRRG